MDTTFLTSSALIQTPFDLFTEESRVAQRAPPKDNRDISCREYYAYKLQIRSSNYLLKAGRLFQQYVVDMYVKIENTRLDFIRRNQTTIRAELYQGIIYSLQIGHNNASDIGHRTILPPSFIGGSHDVKRRYLNATTLVQKFGKPDLFITMTCNPNRPEIQDNLLPEKKLKTQQELTLLSSKKRGLPHAHLLIILERPNKIVCPEKFDQYVCA
ncbi:hypothetical protein V2J09_002685 [Rumex salicifolius]